MPEAAASTSGPERSPGAALLPGAADLVFVPLLLLVVFVMNRPLINADGDIARHLRIGSDILRERRLPTTDRFSFSRAGEPFLPFEWGSEVAYAAVHRAGGIPGVTVFAGVLIALTMTLLVVLMMHSGADPLLALLTGWVAAANSLIHFLARPHLFTLLAALLLWYLLERVTKRNSLLVLPMFAVWANLHGGFVFGFILIVAYLAGSTAEWLFAGRDPAWKSRAETHAAMLGLALLGSLMNPFGFRLLGHVFGFLGGSSYLQDKIAEFWSPNFHAFTGKIFLLTLMGVVGALLLSRRRLSGPRLLLLGTGVAFALLAQRNISLFAVTALPAVALHLDPEWRALRSGLLRRFRRAIAAREAAAASGLWAVAVAGVLAAIAANGGMFRSRPLIPASFDAEAFPVEAVRRMRAEALPGRVFADIAWGGYLRYAWPEQKVFLDPGTDHYGAALVRQQLRVSNLEPGWRATLRDWRFATLVVPSGSSLAYALSREPEWRIWYCDGTTLVARRAGAPAADDGTVQSDCPASLVGAGAAT